MSIVLALFVVCIIALIFGGILGWAAIRYKVEGDPLVDKINQVLPQTQCGQCGYPGCKPYAEAIANGDEINKCPPGGDDGVRTLADLLGRDYKPLDASHGEEGPKTVAYIREDECIGCTKCIQACPVDAILGAPKLMHTVIVDECTGCDLCVEPCPVDCIDMLPLKTATDNWVWPSPQEIIPVKMISD